MAQEYSPYQQATKITYVVAKGDIILGWCVQERGGWVYQPNNAAHRRGRTPRRSPVAAIPRRDFNLSDTFVTHDEWKRGKLSRLS